MACKVVEKSLRWEVDDALHHSSYKNNLISFMKLNLNQALRAALMACYAVATPIATTLSTGAIIAGVSISLIAPQVQADDEDDATDLGNVMYVGDSITHGTDSSSYRWALHKIFADNGISYNAVGEWSTCYSTAYNETSYGGVSYSNVHSAYYSTRADEMLTEGFRDSSRTTLGSILAKTDEVDNFFMLIGTNDFLSDYDDDDYDSAGDFAYTEAQNTLTAVDSIVTTMLADSPDANITLMTVPTFTDEQSVINADATFAAVSLYNHLLLSAYDDVDNVTVFNTNVGLSDVTLAYEATYTTSEGDVITYTVDSQMHDDFTYESGDAVHLSDQASLIVASNLAKALGYAGRTAGQSRVAASDFGVNVTSDVSNSSLTGAGFTHSNVSDIDGGGVSLSDDSSISYTWGDDATLTKGYTLDLSLDLGNGATDGWDTTSMLTIELSGAGYTGSLVINEGYIMWAGDTVDNAGNTIQSNDAYSVLYSYDMSTLSDLGDLRVAYVAADAENGLAGGYYIWIDDMLIGEALTATSYTGDEGVTISYNGDGTVTITSIAVDGDAAYAPTTTGITTDDGYVADYTLVLGPGTIVSSDWAASVTQTGTGDLQTNLRGLSDATEGDVSVTVTGGTMSSVVYANQGAYTGDVWAEITAGSISNTNWYAGHNSSTLTGDVYLKFTDAAGGTGGTVFGGVIGTIDGNVYLEFSAEGASFGTWSTNSGTGQASVAGSYQTNVTGDITMVFNAGDFDYRIMGGIINGSGYSIGGSTSIYINGGSFAQDIIGGGYTGTIKGNTNIAITGGTIAGNVYGGGTGDTIEGSTYVTIDGDTVQITGGTISAGGTGGTIAGSSTLTIQNLTSYGAMASYTGTLSGGNAVGTKTLAFDAVSVSSFGATITGFDAMTMSDSTLGLTLTSDKTLELDSLGLTDSSTLNLTVSSGTSRIDGISTDSTSTLGTVTTTGNLSLGGAAEGTVKISSLNASTGSITFDGGHFSIAATSNLNATTTNTINIYNGADVAFTTTSDWYLINTNFAFTADEDGNSASMSYAGRMCLMGYNGSISGDGTLTVASFLLAGSSSSSAAIFDVTDGATLYVTTTLDLADTASSSRAIDGTLNITGATFITDVALAASGGTAQVNVSGATQDDGSLVAGVAVLAKGFTATDSTSTMSFNANSGSLIKVGSQAADCTAITVSFNDGSTLIAMEGAGDVTMAQSINYGASSVSGDSATVTFAAGTGDSLILTSAVAAAVDGVELNAKIAAGSMVEFAAGATLQAIEVAADSTLALGGDVSISDSITLSSGASIDLSDITSLSFGEDFSLILDYALEYGTDYTIFTGATSDYSSSLGNITSTDFDSTLYEYTWTYDDAKNISLSLTAIEDKPIWDETTGDATIPESSTSDSEFVFDADDSISDAPTIDTGSTGSETESGTTTTGSVVVTGDAEVTISGDNDLVSSGTITVGDATLSTDVIVSTGVSADGGIEVASGSSISVDKDGSIAGTDVTLAEGTSLTAGNITVTAKEDGAGVVAGDTTTIAENELSSAEVAKSTVTVTGDGGTLTDTTIDANSTLTVEENSALSLTGTSSVSAKTTIASGASIEAGVITLSGSEGGATVSYTGEGSLSADTLSNAVISGASIVVSGTPTVTGGSLAALLAGDSYNYSGYGIMNGGSLQDASSVTLTDSAQLTMNNVVVGADTTFTAADTTKTGLVLNGNTIEANSTNLIFDGTSGALSTGTSVASFTIDTFSTLTSDTNVSITGSLALALTLDADTFATVAGYYAGDDLFDIVLDFGSAGVDITAITADDVVIYITNASTGASYTFIGSVAGEDLTVDGSKLVVTIPEPSTATLSLLALAGLLARRRRKA